MSQVAMTPVTPMTPSLFCNVSNPLATAMTSPYVPVQHPLYASGVNNGAWLDYLSNAAPQTRDLLLYLTSTTAPAATMRGGNISGQSTDYSFSSLHCDDAIIPSTAAAKNQARCEREQAYRRCMLQLKSEVVQVQTLVREANYYAQQLQQHHARDGDVQFDVTLRIPARNLSPNYRNLGSPLLVEAAALVKQQHHNDCWSQVWSVEKLKSRLVDMRDVYEQNNCKTNLLNPLSNYSATKKTPFYSPDDNFVLIGIANLYLVPLFQQQVAFSCRIPIISQHGEVCGRLDVELALKRGYISLEDRECEAGSFTAANETSPVPDKTENSQLNNEISDDESNEDEENGDIDTTTQRSSDEVVINFSLQRAENLPSQFSGYVFCQYIFWDEDQPTMATMRTKLPAVSLSKHYRGASFSFGHTKQFVVQVNDDFIEHCLDGALSIEVWGYRTVTSHNTVSSVPSFANNSDDENTSSAANVSNSIEPLSRVSEKTCTVADQWKSVSRKLEMWVEVLEINSAGQYESVQVLPNSDVLTGGIYCLRQGQQRLIRVNVRPVAKSGFLPLNCQTIVAAAVGGLAGRKFTSSSLSTGDKNNLALDSYQDDDLQTLRYKWATLLERRKIYLNSQLKAVADKAENQKSPSERERERTLLSQWVNLQDEFNAMENPEFSDIPGAPPSWHPPLGMETHIPVLFMDTEATVNNHGDGVGADSFVETELDSLMLQLPLVRLSEGDFSSATFSWDSALQDSPLLNCVTRQKDEYVYMIVKCIVRLTHPVPVNVHLRKRICLQIVSNNADSGCGRSSSTSSMASSRTKSATAGFTKFLMKSFYSSKKPSTELEENSHTTTQLCSTGVTYDLVARIPRDMYEYEDRESLAYLAASGLSPNQQPTSSLMAHSHTDNSEARFNNNNNFNSYDNPAFQQASAYSTSAPDAQEFVDKYIRAALDVDDLLRMEQLRQHLYMKELLLKQQARIPPKKAWSSNGQVAMCRSVANTTLGQMRSSFQSLVNLQQKFTNNSSDVAVPLLHHSSSYNLASSAGEISSKPITKQNSTLHASTVTLDPFSTSLQGSLSSCSELTTQQPAANIREEENSQQKMEQTRTASSSSRPCFLNVRPLVVGAISKDSFGKQESHLLQMPSVSGSEKVHSDIRTAQNLRRTSSPRTIMLPLAEEHTLSEGSRNGDYQISPQLNEVAAAYAEPLRSASSLSNGAIAVAALPDWLRVGAMCRVLRTDQQKDAPAGKSGHRAIANNKSDPSVVRYIGSTRFAPGAWVGVEFVGDAGLKRGRNDGSVKGVRYFSCKQNCGVFVRPDRLLMPLLSTKPDNGLQENGTAVTDSVGVIN